MTSWAVPFPFFAARPGAQASTLRQARPGHWVRIRQVHGEGGLAEQLLEHGLTIGTAVHVLRRGLFGGHVQIGVRGAVLSLHAAVASLVEVETI